MWSQFGTQSRSWVEPVRQIMSKWKRTIVLAATPLLFLGGLLPGEYVIATSEASYVIMGVGRLCCHVTGVVELILG